MSVNYFLWLWLGILSLAVDLVKRSITVHICVVSRHVSIMGTLAHIGWCADLSASIGWNLESCLLPKCVRTCL